MIVMLYAVAELTRVDKVKRYGESVVPPGSGVDGPMETSAGVAGNVNVSL